MLTVVSIDNINILQPHAVVSSLDKTRSWHGASYQGMQPLPKTGLLSIEELAQPSLPCSQTQQSPVAQHRNKHKRTLTEQKSPPTHVYEPIAETTRYEYNSMKPTINDFLLTDIEKTTLSKLKADIHLAMLMKYFNHQSECAHLPSITSLVHCLHKQSEESECSNVVYFDVLSEKEDSKVTILHIIGKIHQIFVSELNQKWVIAVGDAKIYDILQDLRTEYGDNLKWLIPFPGDWHVLFNYHKALHEALC